jgi:hypothetical protein
MIVYSSRLMFLYIRNDCTEPFLEKEDIYTVFQGSTSWDWRRESDI